MSPGTRGRARSPADCIPDGCSPRPAHVFGGFTFAEHPDLAAPEARIIWHADIDPGTLAVSVSPTASDHPDAFDPARLAPWLTVVTGPTREYAVLSDGWRRIRIDIVDGSLIAQCPVLLRYHLDGIIAAEPKIMPLRRLLDLHRRNRFAIGLYPRDRRVARWVEVLRVHDAIASGASHRAIMRVLFDDDQIVPGSSREDSLRSRVRRLAADARHFAQGGYRRLMRGDSDHSARWSFRSE